MCLRALGKKIQPRLRSTTNDWMRVARRMSDAARTTTQIWLICYHFLFTGLLHHRHYIITSLHHVSPHHYPAKCWYFTAPHLSQLISPSQLPSHTLCIHHCPQLEHDHYSFLCQNDSSFTFVYIVVIHLNYNTLHPTLDG
jgi:hypothetical protein